MQILFLEINCTFISKRYRNWHQNEQQYKRRQLYRLGTASIKHYTPNGYIVPEKFGVHFLPLTKNVPKRTKLHLNEISLNNTEYCKSQSQLRQPPISWKIRYVSTFCNTGVRLNVTAMLCILCKYAFTTFRG